MTTVKKVVVGQPHRAKAAIDSLLMLLAVPIALWIASGGSSGSVAWLTVAIVALVLLALKWVGYVVFHIQYRSWATVTFRDMGAVVGMAAVSTPLAYLLLAFVHGRITVPITLPLIDGMVTVGLVAGVRAVARYWYERVAGGSVEDGNHRRVLVVGAGKAGTMTVSELLRHPELGIHPVAFLDDDAAKQGLRVSGIRVLGTLEDAPKVVREHRIDEVLIAIPSDRNGAVRQVVDLVKGIRPGLSYKIVPGMYEVLSGKVDVRRIRDVDITDLLGRPPVRLDVDAILGYLEGKRVLVTGAGGSIGSELVRQICRFRPAELILFGHGENSIYNLERELDREWPDIRYQGVIGAIQNRDRLDTVFAHYQPEVVFHAAAHKHVPLMEQNPEEAVFNNIIGSRNLLDMSLKHHVSHFVAISTDKAVNATSVMGASKRMVEHLVKDAASRAAPDQVFVAVRFGNVLGSRGSVIPVFKSQIEAGGPVTVTHPDMVRYFMTIPEAAQLVLQASGMGRNNQIFILDMGEPVRILDLATDLIRLSGLEPYVDIPITFTGMRPGERLSEILLTSTEQTIVTAHEKILIAQTEGVASERLNAVVDQLQAAALVSDNEGIRSHLQDFLEEADLGAGGPRRPTESRQIGQPRSEMPPSQQLGHSQG